MKMLHNVDVESRTRLSHCRCETFPPDWTMFRTPGRNGVDGAFRKYVAFH